MINHKNCVYVRNIEGSVLIVRIKAAISPASNIKVLYYCHRTSDLPVPIPNNVPCTRSLYAYEYATDAVVFVVKCGGNISICTLGIR